MVYTRMICVHHLDNFYILPLFLFACHHIRVCSKSKLPTLAKPIEKYSNNYTFTTTEYAFVPGHLSRLPLGPGQKVAFIPGPKASRASEGQWTFCPDWRYQPGQKVPFCPG